MLALDLPLPLCARFQRTSMHNFCVRGCLRVSCIAIGTESAKRPRERRARDKQCSQAFLRRLDFDWSVLASSMSATGNGIAPRIAFWSNENQKEISPSTVFFGQPRETMATFLSGFGGSLVARDAVAGPTSEAVVDVERAAATPRVGVGFLGIAFWASVPPRCAATPVAWGSFMSTRRRLGQWAWRLSFSFVFVSYCRRRKDEKGKGREGKSKAKPNHFFSKFSPHDNASAPPHRRAPP